uniref:Uncharacterized protein n=1 Tax=Rhizophora mucronata TaxID=61149 RepID=A0A2P2IN99_RHIMU
MSNLETELITLFELIVSLRIGSMWATQIFPVIGLLV